MTALEHLNQALADPDALRAQWEELDQLIEVDDVLWIEFGRPDADRLAVVAREFEETCDAPFPADLREVWRVYNGLAISADLEPKFGTVNARDLSEPQLWSADQTNDHYLHIDSDRLGDAVPFAFAGVADLGVFVLEVLPRDADPRVFWIDDAPQHSPVFIANNFTDFVAKWCDYALNLPILLRAAEAPGWG